MTKRLIFILSAALIVFVSNSIAAYAVSTNDAKFISQVVPNKMEANRAYFVSITMQNTGTNTWTYASGYKLGSQNPQDNKTWGTGRVYLNTNDSIAPGQQKTFTFNITTPSALGTYNFQWRMVQEGVQWFGEFTPNIAINIVSGSVVTKSADLNSKLGVTHVAGMYPQVGADFLVQGAQDARDRGFQNIEFYLSPETCTQNAKYPNGSYQTVEWCPGSDLVSVANNARYLTALGLPFKTFLLTTEAFDRTAANTWRIKWDTPFTQTELDSQYNDFYQFVKYLLTTYQNTSKTFIIQTPNEMDWQLLPATDSNIDPTDQAIQNAIIYWNNIQKAVDDAKRDNPSLGINIYHGCEVNLVKKALSGGKTATNNVIPSTHCDLYGYSAYDTATVFSNPNMFIQALDLLAQKAPDSVVFGDKNIYISEFALAENIYSLAQALTTTEEKIDQAFKWGVQYFFHWQLYDNGCTVANPTNSDCPGRWIRKPSGDLSDTYNQIYLKYQEDSTIPIATITNPANNTSVNGTVNINVNATDNIIVDKVEFYIDNQLFDTEKLSPFSYNWDTSSYVNNSEHTIFAKAYDKAGNIGTSSSTTITIIAQDVTPPTLSITNPADGSIVTRNTTVNITANASDISGISKVEFYVNGSLKCTAISVPYSCNWKVPPAKKATYTLQAKAYDTAGNIATSSITVKSSN